MTGLELLGLLFLALLGLGAYAFYQACKHAPPFPYACSDCGERAESSICELCLEARR